MSATPPVTSILSKRAAKGIRQLMLVGPCAFFSSRPPAVPWSVDRWGRTLVSLALLTFGTLSWAVHPAWMLGVAAVAVNLALSSLTDTCALRDLLLRLGARQREDLFAPGGGVRPVDADSPSFEPATTGGDLAF